MEKSLKRTFAQRAISILLTFMMVLMLLPWSTRTAQAETMVCKVTESSSAGTLNTEYATLQAAIDAVNTVNTATITLMSDITECVTFKGQNLTIDLNDHVLCGDRSGTVITTISGSLTVKDTAEHKTTRYFTDSKCSHNIAIGELCENCDGTSKADSCYETYEGNTAKTEGAIAVTGGVITGGYSVDRDNDAWGGGINAAGTLNLYDVNLIGNYSYYGGGLYLTNNAMIKDCMICGNAADAAGGIYCHENITTIINSVISYNYASSGYGGVRLINSDGCFLQGTRITMADGSLKNIEDVEVGESVRTFDHMTGALSSEKVCIAYQKNGKHRIVTLHFTDNPDLSIALGHGLFEKEEGHYVTITPDNAKDYVGKHFYNADSGSWEKLESVSFSDSDKGIYALVTEHHLNCIADNLLTAPKEAELILNAFEYDENLAVDQAQLQSDINQYGLLESTDCFDVSDQMYDIFDLKYLSISLGKNVCTEDEVRDALCFTERAMQASNASTLELQSAEISEPDCNTYADGAEDGTLILGDNVIIKNNHFLTNDLQSNLSIMTDATLKLIDPESASGIDIGITIEDIARAGTTGKFVQNVVESNIGFFTSDWYNYGVKYVAADQEAGTPSYIALVNKYINISSDIHNGTVSTDKRYPDAGEEVTITVTPDKGYQTDTVTVTDSNGTELTVTDNKFTLPTDEALLPVKIVATFKAVTTVKNVKYQSSTATFISASENLGTVTTYYKVNGVWTTKKPTAPGTYQVGFTVKENTYYTALGTKTSPKTTSPATYYKIVDAAAVKAAKELALNKGLKITQTGSKVSITFGKVSGAAGYNVYGAYCGSSLKLLKTVKTNTVTITKLNGKALDLKKNYKFMVVAYKLVNGKKVTIVKSIAGHVVGRKNTKYTNAKSIKLTKTSFTLAVGKTAAVKAKTILVDSSKKQLTNAHANEFRYATSNKAIATVSQKGTIKAVKKGTCYIYVFSRNGLAKSAKVTVK